MTDKEKIQKRLREHLKLDDVVEIHTMLPSSGQRTYFVRLHVKGRLAFPTVTNRSGLTNEIRLQGVRSRENGEKAAAKWFKWLYAEGILKKPDTEGNANDRPAVR